MPRARLSYGLYHEKFEMIGPEEAIYQRVKDSPEIGDKT